MPKRFRPQFKVGRIVAHIRQKNNGVYEIRCQIEKKQIAASSKYLDTAKEKFIEALKNTEKSYEKEKIKKSVTLGEYMIKWLETVKKPYIKENTYHDYFNMLKFQICPAFGNRPLNSISQFEIQAFFNSYTERGKNRTAKKIYLLLNAVFEYAVGDDIIKKSPISKINLGDYEKEHGEPLTHEEEKALVAALIENGDKYSQAFVFLIYTGLRRSELSSVKVANGWVYVNTSKIRKGRAEKPRAIPVSPMLSSVLPLIDIDAIKDITPEALTKNFKKILPSHHLHDTRHTFITRCQECGIQREIVSLWAGHAADSSITSTVYTHLGQNKQHQVDEMKRFRYDL